MDHNTLKLKCCIALTKFTTITGFTGANVTNLTNVPVPPYFN